MSHFLTEFNRLLTDLILYIFFSIFLKLNYSIFIHLFYFCLLLRKKTVTKNFFFQKLTKTENYRLKYRLNSVKK